MSKQHRFILKLSLTYRGNVNYQQIVHHPLSTLPVRTENTLEAFQTNQEPLLSNSVQINYLPGQTEGRRRAFFGGGKPRFIL